jgi:hypothetical protein
MRTGRAPGVALAALLAACAARQPAPADPFAGRPLVTASAGELARALDADAAAVVSLRGKLALEVEERGGARRGCRGALAARNPWTGVPSPGLYVQGTRPPLPTLFTLVSDAERFWLHVPSEGAVYTGPLALGADVAAPGKRAPGLDARDLLRALFVEPIGGAPIDVAEEAGAYVVAVRGEGGVRRRLWVERRRLAVLREVRYGADGAEELAIERGRHAEVGGRVEALRLVVRDLARGGTARLDFDALQVNPPEVDGRAFRPRLPPGARVVELAARGGGP